MPLVGARLMKSTLLPSHVYDLSHLIRRASWSCLKDSADWSRCHNILLSKVDFGN